jgi:hypothetical protein
MVVLEHSDGSRNVFYEATMRELRARVDFNLSIFERGGYRVERYNAHPHIDFVRNSPRGYVAFANANTSRIAVKVRKADRVVFV